MPLTVSPPVAPMLARLAHELPVGPDMRYERPGAGDRPDGEIGTAGQGPSQRAGVRG